MKRANRLIQIEKHKREVNARRGQAMAAGQRPLAVIKQYPVLFMTVSAMVAGIVARRMFTRPLPAAIKLLAIPLARRFVRNALLGSQQL